MKENKNEFLYQFTTWFIVAILCGIVGGLIALEIIAVIKYGNAPVEEIPNWANWFLQRGKNEPR